DKTLRLWDLKTGIQIATLEGHTYWVNIITLFENDCLLVSASDENTVHLWNLDTNLQVGPPLQHEDRVNCAALSADGKLLVTGGRDKNAYVWDIHAILKDAGLEDLLSIPHVSPDTSCFSSHANLSLAGSDNRPSSIVAFQPTSSHMQPRHARYHHCLKMRFRQRSLCETSWLLT
ncbi:WD40 repeat-like protein, partial [Suillus hirtellus]